jgi:hypothetical protein
MEPFQYASLSLLPVLIFGGGDETARVRRVARLRGRDSAYGACAAAGDAGDRICQQRVAQRFCASRSCVPPRAERNGYIDGENVTIEYRWAEGQFDRLLARADEVCPKRTSLDAPHMSAFGGKRTWPFCGANVCYRLFYISGLQWRFY